MYRITSQRPQIPSTLIQKVFLLKQKNLAYTGSMFSEIWGSDPDDSRIKTFETFKEAVDFANKNIISEVRIEQC